ncbi:bifunctional pyr operon transcriptional regulator/uracil phosphoribosyltransferase PyrR [Leptothoe kymatousa]|uniref:Bifunctional protein PyrR n=1 Tax=Leptothoe kymatousa TAU-MAC 1615 TaxID=2364775 RepID=A0ABS5Y213_9CYAN|nr:bifunctional pyr operon transcriptional regulator/uracil phosphoribosyltransferase PyrR [Leptothoe kymatousa]MBT9311873.1 bifunctional pyr operon transcriptional regulator/uracil phosphoribosyltransferase PyrR [Leptothoe kymatousa TAU-MAC 1615]
MADQVVEILSAEAIRRTLNRLASEIIERTDRLEDLVLVGIHTRGIPLAQAVAKQMERLEGIQVLVGELDITFYRDDLDQISTRTPAQSKMPCDLTGKKVVLVDDVIFSGRTIRAALNAVIDYGRPNLIRLAVLIDRGHRQLPIHPDFIGKALPTAREEVVNVQLKPVDDRDTVELIKPAA